MSRKKDNTLHIVEKTDSQETPAINPGELEKEALLVTKMNRWYAATLEERTAKNAQQRLERWRSFAHSLGKTLLTARDEEADEYLLHYKTRLGNTDRRSGKRTHVSPASQKVEFSNLRYAYDEMLRRGLASNNPFYTLCKSFRGVKGGEKQRNPFLTEEEIERIFQAITGGPKEVIRNRGWMALEIGGGLRVGEARHLRMSDVNLQKVVRKSDGKELELYRLRLRFTKHKKSEAFQPVSPKFTPYITALLAQREAEGANDESPLIVVYCGEFRSTPKNDEVVCYETVRSWWDKIMKLAKIKGRCSTHTCRATAVTQLLSQGFDYREVQEFSRHASIRMVELYDRRRIDLSENPALSLYE